MEEVGAYEAKTHLPKLLEQVSRGKEIIITRHGLPVAKLSPYDDKRKFASEKVIRDLKQFRKKNKLNGLDLKAMIETGRD